MAQEYYSFEEAVDILGISTAELEKLVDKHEIRAFADGNSWKFRQRDVDEVARSHQFGTDPDVELPGNIFEDDGDIFSGDDDDVDIMASDDEQIVVDARELDEPDSTDDMDSGDDGEKTMVRRRPSEDELDKMIQEDADESEKASGGEQQGPGMDDEEDVHPTISKEAVPQAAKDSKDPGSSKPDSGDDLELGDEFDLTDEGSAPAEESGSEELDLEFDLSGDDAFEVKDEDSKISLEDRKKAPPVPAASEEEETPAEEPSGTMELDALDEDDILLSDEAIASPPASSGINLVSPNDSGISLEKEEPTSDSEFESSLEEDEDELFGDVKKVEQEDVAATIPAIADTTEEELGSESDFELALGEDEGNLLEDEESASEVIALEDESDSEDIEIDQEDEFLDDEEEEEDYEEYDEYEKEEVGAGVATLAATGAVEMSTPWPAWMPPVLAMNSFVLAVVGIMLYEVLRNTWSYSTPYPMSESLIDLVVGIKDSIMGP